MSININYEHNTHESKKQNTCNLFSLSPRSKGSIIKVDYKTRSVGNIFVSL